MFARLIWGEPGGEVPKFAGSSARNTRILSYSDSCYFHSHVGFNQCLPYTYEISSNCWPCGVYNASVVVLLSFLVSMPTTATRLSALVTVPMSQQLRDQLTQKMIVCEFMTWVIKKLALHELRSEQISRPCLWHSGSLDRSGGISKARAVGPRLFLFVRKQVAIDAEQTCCFQKSAFAPRPELLLPPRTTTL